MIALDLGHTRSRHSFKRNLSRTTFALIVILRLSLVALAIRLGLL